MHVPAGACPGAPGERVVLAWRHPRPTGAEGLCIGARTDLGVDARRAKRLAHRIRAATRRDGLPREVATSPLRRCAAVAAHLRRFGFRVQVDVRLTEFDFGRWEGRAWSAIPRCEVDAWTADFANCAVGGAGVLRDYLRTVRDVLAAPPAPLLLTHGGWLSAARWCASHGNAADAKLAAALWPAAPRHGECVRLRHPA